MRNVLIFSVLFSIVSISFGYNIQDTAEGWASLNGGTTGGAGGEEVTVSTFAELKKAAESTGKKVILVKKGNYSGNLNPQSDKSILGLEPGVKLDGTMAVTNKVHNVIIRNIAIINSKPCVSYKDCQSGTDAVYVGRGATNVWLDHLDISDGQDGNCDVTKAADFVTITWCKFWYTYPKDHAFSNLIAGSNSETESRGKLNITYAYNWWADNVISRQPWGRFGKIHVVNNLWTSQRTESGCASGVEMQMLLENGVYNCTGKGYKPVEGAYKLVGNIGTNKYITGSKGTVFTPPYTLSLKMEATDVEEKVRASAGNTLTLSRTGTVRNQPGKRVTAQPYITRAVSGWVLHNPTFSTLSFTVATINGKTVTSASEVSAGHSIHLLLPSSSMFYIVYIHTSDGLFLSGKIPLAFQSSGNKFPAICLY